MMVRRGRHGNAETPFQAVNFSDIGYLGIVAG